MEDCFCPSNIFALVFVLGFDSDTVPVTVVKVIKHD
jgi:hypothetical protein